MTVKVKSFNSETNRALSSFVISFTRFSGDIPDKATITGISFAGRRRASEFENSRFLFSEKSLSTRLSSVSRSSAGFKSIESRQLSPRFKIPNFADALSITGPLTPK
ncbi:hypothetical protein SDC9_139903 [bioreactor metagenome]|uniref:Uncharacterized protein n=1 Tax=bioreactor metagenome TaxID=1076179 RepID=A0A645DTT0_9ZZZZ